MQSSTIVVFIFVFGQYYLVDLYDIFVVKERVNCAHHTTTGRCGIVQQVVKCSIYYNNLSGGCGLFQQIVKCSILVQ
jgi:hypothetical protein